MRNLRNHENHDFHLNFEVAFGLAKHSISSTFSTVQSFISFFKKTHLHYFPYVPTKKVKARRPVSQKVSLANWFYKGKSNQDFHERENGAVDTLSFQGTCGKK